MVCVLDPWAELQLPVASCTKHKRLRPARRPASARPPPPLTAAPPSEETATPYLRSMPPTMALRSIIFIALLSGGHNNGVHCYSFSPVATASRPGRQQERPRPSMLQLRRVVRSWSSAARDSRLPSSFYDDFEDFGELGSNDSNGDEGGAGEAGDDKSKAASAGARADDASSADDDAVMKELRKRMSDLQNDDDDEEDEDEEDDNDTSDDFDSGSALPDLEGNTISNIDDLIGFAQAKARESKQNTKGTSSLGGGTWEDENWARPVPYLDETTGELLNFEDVLEGGVVLVANPAKFCSDLVDGKGKDKPKQKGNAFLGGLFDDPFPTSQSSKSSNTISPALLAKFGITLPPSPDLGPDRRADLLPVVLLINRDPLMGCQAVLMNRRTGNLMGDLPPSIFDTDDEDDTSDGAGYPTHPLGAFMIQPLWWAGSSPGGSANDEDNPSDRGGGLKAIDMVHACPYVKDCVSLPKSDGLYWGGNPVEAQNAMKDSRLEKPMSGFDFKFFIQTTRWLPNQVCVY